MLYSTYASTTKNPGGAARSLSLLSVGGTESKHRPAIRRRHRPAAVGSRLQCQGPHHQWRGFIRAGRYLSEHSESSNATAPNRFDTSPNIDFREFFYTAKGAYGELLAGRALNLYQGKNILTDMTLLTAGVVPGSAFRGNTTLGHIGYGYLYTNFGPQIRYTTPDLAASKWPSQSANPTQSVQIPTKPTHPAWRQKSPTPRPSATPPCRHGFRSVSDRTPQRYRQLHAQVRTTSRSAAPTASASVSAVSTCWPPVTSARDSACSAHRMATSSGQPATDADGNERLHWGYLAPGHLPADLLGHAGRQLRSDPSGENRHEPADASSLMKNQEAATTSRYLQLSTNSPSLSAEYIYAQNTWMDRCQTAFQPVCPRHDVLLVTG